MKHKKISIALAITVLAGFLQGCDTMPGSGPSRNKMPELTDMSNGFESNASGFQSQEKADRSQFGLTATNADMDFGGERESCVVVSLPSSAMDSVAFNLVKTYGMLSSPLINEWAKRDRKGVVLDLREEPGNGSRSSRAQYLLKSGSGSDIPVVFIWDQRSASRAFNYTQTLEHFSGINLRPLSSN